MAGKKPSQTNQAQKAKAKAKALRKTGKAKAATPSATRKRKTGKAVVTAEVLPGESKRGRPTALTEELAARICVAVGTGHFVNAAMSNEGLDRSTFYLWRERGEQDKAAGKSTIYAEFIDMIKKAEFTAEDDNLKLVKAGGFGWQGNAWILERRYPGRWGNRFKFSMDSAKDFMRKFLTVASQHIPDREVLKKIVDEVRKIEGEAHALSAGKP